MIALQTKSHTLAESIILPACKKIVETILGDKAEQEIHKIPVSNNTIQRCIVDLRPVSTMSVEKSILCFIDFFALQF